MAYVMRAIDMKNGNVVNIPDETQMGIALRDGTHWPVNDAGDEYTVQSIEGGHIVEGAPLNVWYRHVWYPEQLQILEPLWKSGQVPTPPEWLMNASIGNIQEMSDDTREEWAQWREVQGLPAYGQFDTKKLLLIGAGALVIGSMVFAGREKPGFFNVGNGDDEFDYVD